MYKIVGEFDTTRDLQTMIDGVVAVKILEVVAEEETLEEAVKTFLDYRMNDYNHEYSIVEE